MKAKPRYLSLTVFPASAWQTAFSSSLTVRWKRREHMKSLLRSGAAIPNCLNCKLRATDSLDQVCVRGGGAVPIRALSEAGPAWTRHVLLAEARASRDTFGRACPKLTDSASTAISRFA